jgi:hypothetical protein
MGNDTVTAVIGSECVLRPSGIRAHKGQTVELSEEEYERLKKAGCLMETATVAVGEVAMKQSPPPRRARGR